MKISYRWLKRYLPIDLNPELVSELLTDTGLEVEGLEEGIGKTPTAVTFSPAMIAAKNMEKQIMDILA